MEMYDLGVHRGETFRQAVVIRDGAGEPMDLSGYAGYAQVRAYPKGAPTDPVEVVCSMDVTIEAAAGKVTLMIGPEVTEGLTAGVYVYDFCTDDGNVVKYWLGGRFEVKPAVTEIWRS